ncbi:MAG: response regulator [Candidatus Pacebacteria bacterium]|nr:response regulator [Candidatus Paceibacterota bacterium]
MKENKVLVLGKRKHTQDVSKNNATQSARSKEKVDKDPVSVGKGKRILIVEDDDFLRGLLSHNLSDVGYKVDSARDAELALRFLARHFPDIILLDLMLPGMNGFDFLAEIKKTRQLAIPVIVLSNLGSKEDIDMALSLGAVDFLVKANVTPAQIVGKVQSVLEGGKT